MNAPARALDFLAALTLPSGETMGASWERDPWLLDDVIRPALARDGDGLPLHRYSWVELPKGSAKTTTAAALALVEAASEASTEVYVLAVDEDQARLCLDALDAMISHSRRLRAAVDQKRQLYRLPNRSFIKVMSSDLPSFHGIGVTARRLRFIFDEVCQWPERHLYDAALATTAKVRDSAVWALTNAGVTNTWQQEARAQLDAGAHLFIAPPGWLPSWMSRADVDALRKTMPEPLWRRYFNNEWVREVGGFIDIAQLDALAADLPPPDATTALTVGVDAAVSGDCFAIVGVSRDRDTIAARTVAVWTPPKGGKLDYDLPRDHLAELCRRHRVSRIVFDEYQLHDFMERFQREHGVSCEPFSQGAARAQADTDLYQLIAQGRLRHDGDATLREHIDNCGFKVTPSEDTRARLVKRGRGKIDAAVALSMAAHAALSDAPHTPLPIENTQPSPAGRGGRLAGLPTHPEVGGGRRSTSRLAGLPGRIRGGPREPWWA